MQYGALYGVVCALQRSLQIKQQLLGADDPELLTTISNIADIYREQVRRKRAATAGAIQRRNMQCPAQSMQRTARTCGMQRTPCWQRRKIPSLTL
jgi:hypothetical protein